MSDPGPDAWSRRYAQANTPWDLGAAHPELERRLEIDPALGVGELGHAYVPGCGRGHDALALALAGWMVVAADFAEILASIVTAALAPHGGLFVDGDALAVDLEVDLWFDHTFFCALPPQRRAEHGRRASEVVRPGGCLVAIVFPIGMHPQHGPPYPMTVAALGDVLGDTFTLEVDEPIVHGRARSASERWAMWRRV